MVNLLGVGVRWQQSEVPLSIRTWLLASMDGIGGLGQVGLICLEETRLSC